MDNVDPLDAKDDAHLRMESNEYLRKISSLISMLHNNDDDDDDDEDFS